MACINNSKLITPRQTSSRKFPLAVLCNMANTVLGQNGELLEYRNLIANQTARATWTHSYGNEIGRLAQGMPGRNTGTNTIKFIARNKVPTERV
jgi:hypothetical protein